MENSKKSYKISDNLFLVHNTIESKAKVKVVEVPTNHIVVIDCSGSMSWDLPKIREQLKLKLPKLLKKDDTISLIWFSGKKEFGCLLEAETVSGVKDLQTVNNAIDRWLSPVGLTGFKDPIDEVGRLINRVRTKSPQSQFSFLFLSDGYDNQNTQSDILDSISSVAKELASATFVEYGYYADRNLLSRMAEKCGGQLVFSQDFDKYDPVFEDVMKRRVPGGPKVEVSIGYAPEYGFAFSLGSDEITTYEASSGSAFVPEGTKDVFWLTKKCDGDAEDLSAHVRRLFYDKAGKNDIVLSAAYSLLSLMSVRMNPGVIYPLLRCIGDIDIINNYAGCYGKQKYSEFMELTKNAAFNSDLRYTNGYDPSRVPDDDAFTLLELLQMLSETYGECNVLLDSDKFSYSRIGRGRIDAQENLSKEEIEKLQELTVRVASEKNVKKLKELNAELQELLSKKGPVLKFVSDPIPNGVPLSNLVFNETTPNISIQVRRTGHVDLSEALPEEFKSVLPEKFPTFIYRNYAVVKDGLVNVANLPVRMTSELFLKLQKTQTASYVKGAGKQFIFESKPDGDFVECVLKLGNLPVINRSMVKAVSAESFFQDQYKLLCAQAAQKVFNSLSKETIKEEKSIGFLEKYGADATAFLKEKGFTDYSGFSPKSTVAPSVDFYMAKKLDVAIKGYSTLPSLNELRKQIQKGKLNGPGALMNQYLEEYEAFLRTPNGKKDAEVAKFLKTNQEFYGARVKNLLFSVSRSMFVLILGQSWFSDMESPDDNSLDLEFNGTTMHFEARLRDVEVKI